MAEATKVIGEAEATEAGTRIEHTSDYVRSQNALKVKKKESANSPYSPVAGPSSTEPERFATPLHSPVVRPACGELYETFLMQQSPIYNPDGNKKTYLPQHTNKIFQPYTPELINVHP